MRPLVVASTGEGTTDWLQLSRKHAIDVDAAKAHVSIYGGKLTDCLNVGEEIAAVCQELGLTLPYPDRVWYGEPGDDALVSELFEALQETETDFTLFFRNLSERSFEALRPAFYDESAGHEKLEKWFVKYLSRASAGTGEKMNAVNPKYVFRNYLAQQAIDALAAGDAGPLERLMQVLRRPYDEQPEAEDLAARRPEWARHKAGCSALSCSS